MIPGAAPLPARMIWSAVVVLALIGITAAYGRTVLVADLTTRSEPLRAYLIERLGRHDPLAGRRPSDFRRFDGPFAAHSIVARLHVIPGAVFLAFTPLQFSSRIRRRLPAIHRWSGRLLLALALVATLAAFFFGMLLPFGGWGETIPITLFGGIFLVSLGRAFVAIRRRDVRLHREWMIRAFAIALGISTVRIVGVALDFALLSAALSSEAVFVMSVWIGWTITFATGEAWIRYTRTRARSAVAAVATV